MSTSSFNIIIIIYYGQYNTLMINRPEAFDNVHIQFLSNIDLGNVWRMILF